MAENAKSKSQDNLWGMIKLGLVLVCYAVASCAVLAVVNNFTSVKIKQNQIEKANKAMKEVFAEAQEFVPVEQFEGSSVSTITVSDLYLAKAGEKTIGAVVQVAGPTYDKGKLIFGVTKDGTVTGMQILELSDSPGFGLKANDSTFKLPNGKTFYGQFTGKNAKSAFTAGETFDAISGATITSNGIAEMMNQGSLVMLNYLGAHNE
ncbi:MAG: FMN-binding protein [Treponema sp.]|nr:FMN-binding protein [Treponema sp.]